MHGADRDIVWLQRDFGIYICNLFDTGQASRVLKMERNSLEHLLQHFCGVTANKEYQNADWRLRPLPAEMLRYAREDTPFLLYIYDLMRIKLLSMPMEPEHCDAALVEVYKKSSDVCMQLYEKELLTENSYLHIYGLQAAGLNSEQLSIVSGLYEWRDHIARSEDESTGYVLPNKILIEIAKQMPVTAGKLRRLLKSRLPYVERNLGAVVSIIKRSMQNAVSFEAAAQQPKMGRVLHASEECVAVNDGAVVIPLETRTDLKIAKNRTEIIDGGMRGLDGKTAKLASPPRKELVTTGSSIPGPDMDKKQKRYHMEPVVNSISMSAREGLTDSGLSPPSTKASGATVQILKRPNCGFGAFLGNSATKKKSDIDKKKEENKLEQIRSLVNLQFHSFLGIEEQSKLVTEEATKVSQISQPEEPPPVVATELTSEDIIMLEESSNKDESNDGGGGPKPSDASVGDSPVCYSSETSKARKQVKFGVDTEEKPGSQVNSARKKKSSAVGLLQIDDGTKLFPQARRRQAFPASGNRSATFRP
ncbi:hypothetical protein ES319_A13G112800v1 [Gossypium barbadense]|uniref:HRDC domain-containing protein n=1 Tax=Gossypium barbadense TaxID=3634 RepID=A0A5J5T3E3_GOSBA|nr:hypothetical protein ES319_A13G112800v1 [Gossypium barbadense]